MDPRTARKILRNIAELDRNQARVRLGVVTDDSPLSVAIGGSDTPYTSVKALDGARLEIDDVVTAVMFGRDLIVLGRLGDGRPGPWHEVGDGGEPAFENSWVNYAGVYAPARFLKDPAGVVHLNGAVKSGTNGTAVFTLPAGWRPGYRPTFAVVGAGNTLGVVEVYATGEVVYTGATTFASLAGVSFLAEQ